MGNQGQKPINPNQITTNQMKSGITDEQVLKHIKDSFRNCSSFGKLTKNQFNQALAVLQTIGFKRLRDTPLADRLFVLFDKGKTGSISQQEFSNGIKDVISDKHNAIEYTFRAYDQDNDNRISKKQFTQLIQQSWMTAFRLLSQYLDPTMDVSTTDIENWAQSKISILNEKTSQIFNGMDSSNKGFIEFQSFKEYVLNSGINQIKAEIQYKSVIIPLTLTELQG